MSRPASSETPGQITLLNEVRRKLIHLSSIGVPLIYWFVSQEVMLALLIPATFISLVIELLRRRYRGFEEWFLSIFGPILRPHESRDRPKVNGATFVLVSATICVALFPKIIAITAAMPEGTGLDKFAKAFPERMFDVGIAEEHGVTFCGGMATQGMKPIAAIYSTFLQRAFDQVFHDVAIMDLPVVFALDRGGIAGADGPTHHGIYDMAYLRLFPNMICMAPRDENELRHMLRRS